MAIEWGTTHGTSIPGTALLAGQHEATTATVPPKTSDADGR